PPQLYLPEDVGPDLGATHSQGTPSSAQHVCHKLVQALEFLELISVNLLLFPWRKEIRSLKTYTGNFAYWVRPVLSEHTLRTILGRLGYVATSEAEFSLVQATSEEDTKQTVFEIFLARVAPLTGPQVPLGPQCHASTRSDSEEFLTCYSDLVLHWTPLFPQDLPLSSPKGHQLQGPALTPGPPSGEAVICSGISGEQPLVLDAAPESRRVTIPSLLCPTPGPQLSGKSFEPEPEAQPELATRGTDTAPPNTTSEMDELCERLSYLLRPPTLAERPRGFPSPGGEENGQSEPLVEPEPASEGGSPENGVIWLWRSTQAPSHIREPPSAHYVPPEGLEMPVPTRGHHSSNS
uniref:Spermatogenesis-associated protein 2 PUB-like domain-containing protein n=1 Tax=Equus caballus TaxID=9796 RepID=A0A9L0SMU8_HORSE